MEISNVHVLIPFPRDPKIFFFVYPINNFDSGKEKYSRENLIAKIK